MKPNYVVVYRLIGTEPTAPVNRDIWRKLTGRKDAWSFPNITMVDRFNTKREAIDFANEIAQVCTECNQYKLQNTFVD